MKTMECFGKINLTLRITGKLLSGYHELCSLFFKIGPFDSLTISRGIEDNVKVTFNRAKSAITGRNILFKALDAVRRRNANVPPLDMALDKNVPPGTGLGAGSGDAAALLSFLRAENCDVLEAEAETGADVPFLCGEAQAALASGIGDHLEPMTKALSDWHAVIVIPTWRCLTPEMYRKLDEYFGGRWPVTASEARAEAKVIYEKMLKGERVGLLPNDFAPVLLNEHPEYQDLFNEFSVKGAYAWGISGSGSSAFALWRADAFSGFRSELPCAEDTFIFSQKGDAS